MDMFIKIFLSTLCCCWTVAALIFYRKYREAKADYIRLITERRNKLDSSWGKNQIILNQDIKINQLTKEVQEWKTKYLDVFEQNLRLAERIKGETE